MWLKVVAFCFIIGAWKTDAKSYPVNTVVFVGETVTMNCSISSFETATWNHVSSVNSQTFPISRGGNVSSERYDLISNPERDQYNLVIKKTIQNDSGTYVCTETKGTTGTIMKHTAQLILLISDPECGTDLNKSSKSLAADEYVSMWCVLEYRGHILTPVMVWRHSSHEWIIPAEEEVHPNNKVESRINVKVGLCENGATFSCTTYFSESDALNASGGMNIIFADNVPGYTYKWTSPMLKVTQFAWNDPRAITLVFFVTILTTAVIILGVIMIKICYEKRAEEKFKWLQRGDAANETETYLVADGQYRNRSEFQKKSENLDQSDSKLNLETKSARSSIAGEKVVYDTIG